MTPEEVEEEIIRIAAEVSRHHHDRELAQLQERAGRRNYRISTLRTMLATAINAQRAAQQDGEVLTDKDYRAIALALLAEKYSHEEGYTLAYWQGVFYRWTGPHWVDCKPKEVESEIYDYMDGRLINTGEHILTCRPGQTMVNEVREALISYILRLHDNVGEWTGDAVAERVISVRNGLLDIDTETLHPHTPRYFTLTSCDADWEGPRSIEGSHWEKFLHDTLGADQAPLLQEAIGYSLTEDTSLQKAFMLIGPKRSGKGTIMRVIGRLVGGLVCSMPTTRFGSDFALQNAVGKTILQMPDVRLDKNTRHGAIAETILSVTGEDTQSINRKHRDEWNGILKCKIWTSSNSIPKFRDEDGVLASRFVYFRFQQSFFGREDRNLTRKLDRELSLILSWAVAGVQVLDRRGYFEEGPTSSALSKQALSRMDPIGTFVAEFLRFSPQYSLPKDHVHLAFHGFCLAHGMTGWTKEGFFRKLMDKDYDGVSTARPTLKDDDGNPILEDGRPIRIHTLRGIAWRDGKEPTREQFREWKADWVDTLDDEEATVVALDAHRKRRD